MNNMKSRKFSTKQEAQDYLNATYPDYAKTGVYVVIFIGSTISQIKGIPEGFYIDDSMS